MHRAKTVPVTDGHFFGIGHPMGIGQSLIGRRNTYIDKRVRLASLLKGQALIRVKTLGILWIMLDHGGHAEQIKSF